MTLNSRPALFGHRTTLPFGLGLCLFLAIAAFFLWQEHRVHLLGALPYAVLLLCPFIHMFMHRGHAGHHGGSHDGVSAEGR